MYAALTTRRVNAVATAKVPGVRAMSRQGGRGFINRRVKSVTLATASNGTHTGFQ